MPQSGEIDAWRRNEGDNTVEILTREDGTAIDNLSLIL